uniref:NOP14 nucleolar protein homolog (yeast) n=1 Tax=Cyprinus carpio TaxID=7962 RepID=A0A8C1U531_CYPCA
MMRKQQTFSRGLSDKVRKSKAAPEIQKNPFEVKINRKKFDVLGRKSKHDVGLPGVSRSRAIQKRKDTLLKEFRLKDKNNTFIDRRFGEYDSKLTPEEKILQRFTLERQRTQDRKDMYNLNEEEELTHYGQSLAEMEKMTDVIDSDSDSEEKGLLSAELTATHFGGGGGLLRKKSAGDEEEEHKPRSRQELIEELIIKSKQEKRERQTQKEEAQELTEKLDQEWKSIQNLLAHKTPKAERTDETDKPKLDQYDMMVRELGFEMKAQPSEKLKSAEELAREERQRLQTLEADRLKRMMGDAEEDAVQTNTHVSADDMNDGFILDGDDRKTLAYKDGKWNIEGEEEEKEDEDGDEEGGEEDEDVEDDAEGEDDDEEEEGEDDEEDDADEDHCDLQSDEGSEDEDGQGAEEEQVSAEEPPAVSEEQKKAAQEAARAELPYTFPAPESYSDLKQLLQGHGSEQQRLILDRTLKCNHPSLSAGNKAKLQKLFGFLLEYVGDLATQNPPDLRTVSALIPQICGLCQMFPEAACKAVQTLLSDSGHSMEETLEVKGRAPMPDLDMLVLLKITALLFPSSDFMCVCVCWGVSVSVCVCECYFCNAYIYVCVCVCEQVLYSNKQACPVTSSLLRLLCLCFRLSLIDSCLDLVKRCTWLYKDLPSYAHIFQPIRALLLKHLPVEGYPAPIQVQHLHQHQIHNHQCVIIHSDVFVLDYGKKRGNTKEEKERERLKHKYKREFKGALREIRKDTRFLAREKLSDVMSRDAERKRKVKELYGSLATQEGEWKALKRKNRK